MLFLTRVILNNTYKLRDVTKNHNTLHKFVMGFFPEKVGSTPRAELGVLWRLDVARDRPSSILIMSQAEPTLESYSAARLAEVTVETKEITPVYDGLLNSGEISLKVRVKPVKRVNGKEMGMFDEEEALAWFTKRLQDNGLEPVEGKITYLRESMARMGPEKGGLSLSANIVARVRVTDRDRAWALVNNGLGRGKSFGFGLIMLGS